jgi:hypothetical protein
MHCTSNIYCFLWMMWTTKRRLTIPTIVHDLNRYDLQVSLSQEMRSWLAAGDALVAASLVGGVTRLCREKQEGS